MEICDATDDIDYPQWETGEERVLASAQCLVLATRSDLDGEVEIEVQVGELVQEPAGQQLLASIPGAGIELRYRSAGN